MDGLNAPKLIKKGAEANLFTAFWQNRKVIIKKRVPKEYRPVELDRQIRNYRTVHEPQLISEAKKAGVPTPIVFSVDLREYAIIMEDIDGKQLKHLIGEITKQEREELCLKIGESIGKLHMYGIVHGDLTTSNMILSSKGKIFFIDFGLGKKTTEFEERGVDLHLMKRALQSTHYLFAEECFEAVIKGYTRVVDEKQAKKVLEKVEEIKKRGRYNVERRKKSEEKLQF